MAQSRAAGTGERHGGYSSHCFSASVPVSSSSRMGVSVPSKERLSIHHGYATAYCMHRIHTFPRCHRAHGFRLTGEGWEGEGGVRRHRRLALLSLALLSRFTSGRPTAVSHYTPRLHPDSNNTILIPRVIEFKVHLGIPFYPITT